MTATAPAPTASTGGRLVYAVGDIHGYSRQLDALLGLIAEDAARSAPAERPLVVFVGDYVDRGPDSPGVIDRILTLEAEGRFEVVCLMGNHEDALLRFLVDPTYAPSWIGNWGEATLRAYGVAPPLLANAATCEAAQAAFRQAFPPAHRAFLGRLRISLTVGDYLFVHAGVRPGVALEAQAERDLIWIRYEFLGSDADFGKVVVHGHTPEQQPVARSNRINIDTGVYFTGLLTAIRLEGESRRVIQARA
jgi:serine/threonine protein phosphatase 1